VSRSSWVDVNSEVSGSFTTLTTLGKEKGKRADKDEGSDTSSNKFSPLVEGKPNYDVPPRAPATIGTLLDFLPTVRLCRMTTVPGGITVVTGIYFVIACPCSVYLSIGRPGGQRVASSERHSPTHMDSVVYTVVKGASRVVCTQDVPSITVVPVKVG
jgi:hypothetical protein